MSESDQTNYDSHLRLLQIIADMTNGIAPARPWPKPVEYYRAKAAEAWACISPDGRRELSA